MGSCLSKKNSCVSSSPSSSVSHPKPPEKPKPENSLEKNKTKDENVVKNEILVIKHRRSREIERQQRFSDEEKCESQEPDEEKCTKVINGSDGSGFGGGAVRASSCTKEEVEAILIQCGRLSRSSSIEKSATENGVRKYSGSKRSYDFDGENGVGALDGGGDEDASTREREIRRRERVRKSQGRRRTPSREREQQRSGSKERGGGGGRRVSRSPGRRSESPITSANSESNSNSSAAIDGNSRPGKMVSVPATAKSSGGGEIRRIQVKRNVGGSPRARSPVTTRGSDENQDVNAGQNQQQPLILSLSRSNSRKAEHSPFRRNPLSEIDNNIISQKSNADNNKTVQLAENRNNSTNLISTNVNCNPTARENHALPLQTHVVSLNVISSSPPEKPKNHPPLTRTLSSRLSRDLDVINLETPSNPNTSSSLSYTALLLEDIQNFHQKNIPPPAFALPACVTKACSILDAVADLNSSTGSNLSLAPFSEQKNKIKMTKPEININITNKDPILESEILANDDLNEPSLHKYVTVKRGGSEEDTEEQESSGSNSFVTGSEHQWVSSSCWEPNSAESTDRWLSSSSSKSVTRQGMYESGRVVVVVDENGKRVSGKKKMASSDHGRNGIGRGRIGSRSSDMAGNVAVSI